MTKITFEELSLPPDVEAVARRIEAQLGRQIVFEIDDNLQGADAAAEGASTIRNGVPTVLLAPQGVHSSNICHELLHLECETNGYPRTITVSETPDFPHSTISTVLTECGSTIEHQLIYPKMIELGFDPSAEVDKKVQATLFPLLDQKDQLIVSSGLPKVQFSLWLTCQVSRAVLETSPKTKSKLRNKAKYFKYSYRRAQRIVKKIRSVNDWSPKSSADCLVDVTSILGIPQSTYQIVSLGDGL